jgi:two-component system phosphate regulon sensor histidine kinase PhoR
VATEERQRHYFDILVEQSERLSLLIENVLDFGRMEEGRKRFEFEPTDIGPWLTDIVTATQERVAHEGRVIRLTLKESLPQITADRAALAQAVHNLIDNAIKYSAGAKEVRLVAHRDACNLVIEVEDSGVGISPEEIGRVFDRFYRGKDPRIRTIRGSGLGLTLVKRIVEAHGGTVQIRSEPGKGSTFSIRLPLKKGE